VPSATTARTGGHVQTYGRTPCPPLVPKPVPERPRASARGMSHVGSAENALCQPPDRDHPTPGGELPQKRRGRVDFDPRRPAVRRGCARMSRDDIPEEHVVFQAELAQDAVDDRRARLARPRSRQLPLRRERDPGDAGAPIPRRLADEEERRICPREQVAAKTLAEKRGPLAIGVLVEGASDPSVREIRDEPSDGLSRRAARSATTYAAWDRRSTHGNRHDPARLMPVVKGELRIEGKPDVAIVPAHAHYVPEAITDGAAAAS
jgi:hypothetical protein